MRITVHPPAVNLSRFNAGQIAVRKASTPTNAAGVFKPIFKSNAATQTASAFGNVLQTVSQSNSSASPSPLPSEPVTPEAATAAPAPSSSTTATAAAVASGNPAATTQKPGIQALVDAMMKGSFKASNVTDVSRLTEVNPWVTSTMPNFFYASDNTANQMAQLLGGKVVQEHAFGQNQGWIEPYANFIELPNGQRFNAADVAYYARCTNGAPQLLANITATINQGAAWSNYYRNGGAMPSFSMGYVGPPISGMDYPAGSIGADGNVINPAMPQTKVT